MVGGEGSSVSAYFGKYLVPYGELKHSGNTTRFAPFEVASNTFDRARDKLADLSAPLANCTKASFNGFLSNFAIVNVKVMVAK